jgi:ribosomal protein L31E
MVKQHINHKIKIEIKPMINDLLFSRGRKQPQTKRTGANTHQMGTIRLMAKLPKNIHNKTSIFLFIEALWF